MTQEEKDLLLKDLCARLPYGVIVQGNEKYISEIDSIEKKCGIIYLINVDKSLLIEDIKPYLRPMSSMTEEEINEFENLLEGIVDGVERWDKPDLCEEYDWLNAHHFDYRGLIPMGLALEATEEMYKN